MRCALPQRGRQNQSGQTLLLAMLAIIILAAAIVFLFDLQNIIRGKIKAQVAADAAALTGAKWQANSLNVIGELNIIKACTTIITDMPETASGKFSDNPLWAPNYYNDVACLRERSNLLSQMQVRASFVGPMIGFGAAQQAAKNNGLSYSTYWSKVLAQKYEYLADESGDIYYGEDVANQSIYGYAWRAPYAEMLKNVLQLSSDGSGLATGVAVNMNSDWVSDPLLISDSDIFNNYLTYRGTYKAINGNYWCALRYLLRESFSTKWWGNIELVLQENNFRFESELLPLKVLHTYGGASIYYDAVNSGAFAGSDPANAAIMDNYNAPEGYDRPSESKLLREVYLDDEDPYLCDENGEPVYDAYGNRIVYNAVKYDIYITGTGVNQLYYIDSEGKVVYVDLYTRDSDECWAPLPRISWTIYNPDYWNSYVEEDSEYWTHSWAEFLRSDFKEGYRYYGAVSWAGITIRPPLISNKWNRLDRENGSDDEGESSYIGEALDFGNESVAAGREVNEYADRLTRAEAAMRNEGIKTEVKALAKPYGRIPVADGKYLIPCAVRMVLPVFDGVKLIPIDLEEPTNVTPDPDWAAFKAEYLPVLGKVNRLEDMPDELKARFSYYHNALLKLDSEEWREQGLEWLTTVTNEETGATNEDSCTYWPSGGTQTRWAPSTPF